MRKSTQLQLPAQRLANRIIPNTAETPVHRDTRAFAQTGRHREGQVVLDYAGGVAFVVRGGVHVRDEHGGAREGGV